MTERLGLTFGEAVYHMNNPQNVELPYCNCNCCCCVCMFVCIMHGFFWLCFQRLRGNMWFQNIWICPDSCHFSPAQDRNRARIFVHEWLLSVTVIGMIVFLFCPNISLSLSLLYCHLLLPRFSEAQQYAPYCFSPITYFSFTSFCVIFAVFNVTVQHLSVLPVSLLHMSMGPSIIAAQ